MKSIQTIIKCNIMYIVYTILNTILVNVYKIEDFDCYAYTTMGGNLCKYAYHLLYINATFIRFIQSIATHIHKYSKNIPFFVQFLYVFVPKLAKNCIKLDIFVPKLYKN